MNPNMKNYRIDFTLPQGPTGPTGPAGDQIMQSVYLATFNNGTVATAIAVPENDRLPIDREEVNASNLITLDTANETIRFNDIGFYKVTFTVSAYVLLKNSTFDPNTDFVSIGFRKVGTDNIYIGSSQFVTDEVAIELVGQGILSIDDTTALYELVNLSEQNIYLQTPNINNISTHSYFATPLLTIVIEYLGKKVVPTP